MTRYLTAAVNQSMRHFTMRSFAIGLWLFGPASVIAGEPDEPETRSATHEHKSPIEVVEVHAHPLSGEGLSQAAVVLEGDSLERHLGASIGDTVGRQPGVHAATFGAAVGRPVIHGMSGARVRIMEDRIDTMDASTASADHATTVEPFIANRIEVLKGPSTLLYGAGAIGGVVDVHTGRIPHDRPESLSGKAELRAADNGRRTNAAVRLDGGGDSVAWHVDAFARDGDEYDIPGFVESARSRATELYEADHDDEEAGGAEHAVEPAFGKLPGSHAASKGGALGISTVGDWGFVGLAVSTLRANYGLPGGHGHHDEDEDHHGAEDGHETEDHADREGQVNVDLDQTRVDFEAGIGDPFASLSSLNIRVGVNDYTHAEIEPSGHVGTVFANNAYEARVELADRDHVGLDGALGLQFGQREFSATGEEAFVPPVDTASIGMFWVAENTFPSFDLETGLRLDRVRHQPVGRPNTDFNTLSASVGVVLPLGDALLGVHGDFSSRAPVAEELYSDGPHLASQAYEVGNPDLDAETAVNGAATVSWQGSRTGLSATAYLTRFRDHIYQFTTGDVDHGLPVMHYGQTDATYRGLDAEASLVVAQFAAGDLTANVMFDTVSAALDVPGNDHLPRLPPSRMGFGLELHRGSFTAALDYLRTFDQDETVDHELPTGGYDDLRAFMAWDLGLVGSSARIFLQGRNLTDQEQRQHTSYIKEFAPLPGRTLELGVRMTFGELH